ncbi:uncharacterized protein SRS1_11363 [Sporisorium reilianum f. sp. reilianum]|uniref:Myb-like domain-containing protein n=1 Tax=Sporisorium reilianum f. sp. reilianum TaxID=72559 RepID=A0A2N8UP12_9BASI|nr:uncharacterized protein SRS1_11363 [Sporisorium reilianum f. sp. reilianum]
MVKRELFKDEYDSYDELVDEEVKPAKRAKTEIKHDDSGADTKPKRPRVSPTKREAVKWTKDEEEALLDCIGEVVSAGLTQAMKQYPSLVPRKTDGCMKHWYSMRRKLETNILGAPTIDNNGRKLPRAKIEAVKQDKAKKEEFKPEF